MIPHENIRRLNQLSSDIDALLRDYDTYEDLLAEVEAGSIGDSPQLYKMRMLQSLEAIKLVSKEMYNLANVGNDE